MLIGGKNVPGSDDIPLLVNKLSLEDKVTLIPLQPRAIIPKYLSACDILCSPKIDCEINRAANPVKVVEYISMGLPAVCSAVGGIIDTIDDGTNGFLVEPGNAKNLKEKLEWIILNSEQAKEIGENGRKTAVEDYSNSAIEGAILQTINEVMNKNGRYI
jgi:glycosyltransferase involved in cell wall biosynthesis